MNVILNTDEVQAVISLVTSQVMDHVELSAEAKEAVRRWRRERDPGTPGLDEYALVFNEKIGNFIDARTTRMMRRRGKQRVSASEERAS